MGPGISRRIATWTARVVTPVVSGRPASIPIWIWMGQLTGYHHCETVQSGLLATSDRYRQWVPPPPAPSLSTALSAAGQPPHSPAVATWALTICELTRLFIWELTTVRLLWSTEPAHTCCCPGPWPGEPSIDGQGLGNNRSVQPNFVRGHQQIRCHL